MSCQKASRDGDTHTSISIKCSIIIITIFFVYFITFSRLSWGLNYTVFNEQQLWNWNFFICRPTIFVDFCFFFFVSYFFLKLNMLISLRCKWMEEKKICKYCYFIIIFVVVLFFRFFLFYLIKIVSRLHFSLCSPSIVFDCSQTTESAIINEKSYMWC